MMDMEETNNKKQTRFGEAYKLGFLLVGAGILILVDQKLQTGWLTISIPAIAGLILVIYGVIRRATGWIMGGSILTGAGAGLISGFVGNPQSTPVERVGLGLLALAIGWLVLFFLVSLIRRKIQWWSLVTAAVIIASGSFLFFNPTKGIFIYLVFLSACLGMVLLSWGIVQKVFGLIIAGSVILSVAPSLYYSWVISPDHSSLVKIGTMLVWLALGWFMISFLGRLVFLKFIWWPIIPGGVLAMVGWGLYLGGAGGKGLSFIGNTGSVALILFGIYLILLKYGLRK